MSEEKSYPEGSQRTDCNYLSRNVQIYRQSLPLHTTPPVWEAVEPSSRSSEASCGPGWIPD